MTGTEETPAPTPAAPGFRLAYVPGATPAKWVRIWHERLPDVPLTLVPVPADEVSDVLRRTDADAGLVRLPVDRTFFSAIPLYTETTVVVVPKDHVVAAVEQVTLADLAEEIVQHPLDDVLEWPEGQPPGQAAFERPATTADAVELVAAGVGLLIVPQSLARLHHRRDLTYRTVTDGPESSVALAWPEERTTDAVEDFIGIVRGRTVNSSRGRTKPADEKAGKRAPTKKAAGQGGKGGSGRPKTGGAGARKQGGKPQGAKQQGGKQQGGKRGKPRKRS
ncbi:LysR substrate-binding domain-containing protein [Streptomyces sp. VRA16 Mangrove soil]|uniref:LysR substrate-binding domain-containing protein n=1 Tax=Streptomyces sp. VRA16 Mangrove soil TaxID=2817434 RepID=UPI001A9FF65E|nr:LysR substrate-binding domain-containing protein [Streptomyces sp. VRA16 Mangrove soil]MBO1332261.1 LysR family transcriptional regulator [Streptomyces sp. VRA16 Mangrove soil]